MKYLMRRVVIAAVTIVSVLSLTAQESFAQMGYYTFESLEWLVADSNVVVRGAIADVSQEPPQDQFIWMTVTLKVDETLKGQPAKSLTFAVNTIVGDKRYEQWRDAGQEQLWFLVRNEQHDAKRGAAQNEISARYPLKPYSGGWELIRLGPAVPDEKGFRRLPPPIFTMNLSVLDKPQEILQAARTAVVEGSTRGAVSSYAIELPHSIAGQSGTSGDMNRLIVPADHRLKVLARRLMQAPDDFLLPTFGLRPQQADERRLWESAYKSVLAQLRNEGVKALRHLQDEQAQEEAVRTLARHALAQINGTNPPPTWPSTMRKEGSKWIVDIDTSKLPGGYPEQIVIDIYTTGGHSEKPKE